jgi:hypothetical protein
MLVQHKLCQRNLPSPLDLPLLDPSPSPHFSGGFSPSISICPQHPRPSFTKADLDEVTDQLRMLQGSSALWTNALSDLTTTDLSYVFLHLLSPMPLAIWDPVP